MNRPFPFVAGLILAGLLSSAITAQLPEVVASPQQGILVLRNGHVLRGQVTAAGDRYFVALSSGEVSVRRDEVECYCKSLDEAYQLKRAAIRADDLDARLRLAEWCVRHDLAALAAKELSYALALAPDDPRIGLLERRLKLARQPRRSPAAVASTNDIPSVDELDRMARGMPSGAVSMFAGTIQPLLLNTCATGECHGPHSQNSYRLLRAASNRPPSRRLTLRNLANTLEWIDRDDPSASSLLTVTTMPHGSQDAPLFVNDQAIPYQQLAAWIRLVASGELESPATVEPESPPLLQRMPTERTAAEAAPHAESTSASTDSETIDTSLERGNFRSTSKVSGSGGAAAREPRPSETRSADPFDPEPFNRRFHGSSTQGSGR